MHGWGEATGFIAESVLWGWARGTGQITMPTLNLQLWETEFIEKSHSSRFFLR